MNKKTFTLNMPERELLALNELAKAEGETKTSIIRMAIKAFIFKIDSQNKRFIKKIRNNKET